MIVHNFDPVLIDLGFFQVRWYSIAYVFGILLGWMYARKILSRTKNFNNNFKRIINSDFDDLIIYLILGIIIGGRLGYVLFYDFQFYTQNLFEILMLWKGGMSFHGGLIGVIISTYIYSLNKKINFFNLADVIACVAPIGIFLGRLANFINGELYGKISTLPWAVIFPNDKGVTRHPSQIYEALLEGIVLFILINFLALRKKFLLKTGLISGFFLIMYSIFRIISENFREPDVHLGYFFNYFSMGTLLSILTLLVGFIIIYIKK